MLFTSILTGCFGPRGGFWTLLRCGPDVSAGALEDKLPCLRGWGSGTLGCHQAQAGLGALCIGGREKQGQG